MAIFSKNAIKRKRLAIVGMVMLFFFSNEVIIGKIFEVYEPDYPANQHHDIGVVLGGYSGLNTRNNTIAFNRSADRLFQAISLYKEGKIGKLLISGGNSDLDDQQAKEANLDFQYLKSLGIPDSALIVENQSRNTIENAKYSWDTIQKLQPKAKILIITSAWHIPRARIIFSKVFTGEVNYYPTNYLGQTGYNWSDFVVPSAEALVNWELLLKEWIGLLIDRIRI